MLEQIAELVGLDDLQVDRQAAVGHSVHAGVARDRVTLHQRQLRERVGELAWRACRRDHVEILDRVDEPPRRAGQLDAVGGRVGAQRREHLVGLPERAGEQHARRRAAAVRTREQLEHLLLDLLAEAAQRSDATLARGGAERVQRVDAQLVEQAPRTLGAESLELHDVEQTRRIALPQLVGRRDRAGLQQRRDLLRERLSDARELGRTARATQLGDRHRSVAYRLGARAIGEHAMHRGAVELVQRTELIEHVGDLAVGQGRHGARLAA